MAVFPMSYGVALVKMLVALALVCALAYVVLRYVVRRLIPSGGMGRELSVVDRLLLGGGQSVWIVRARDRSFLIGSGSDGARLIAELERGGPQVTNEPEAR